MSPFDLVVAMFVLAPAAGIAATAYLWLLYRSDSARPRSWLLLLLARGATAVNVAAIYFAALAAARLLGIDVPRWTVVPSAFALLLLEAVPVYSAAVMYSRGRAARARQKR